MKKFVIIAMALIFASTMFATAENNKRNEDKWSSLSYYNVPILKILEAKEGFVVIYQKNNNGTGSTVIPKTWSKGSEESPRKLKFRFVTGNVGPFMSVVKKDGNFFRVILSLPKSHRDPVWGVLKYESKTLEGLDKENLDDIQLY